jgi:tetratricopeptide (TPR) repeat protein
MPFISRVPELSRLSFFKYSVAVVVVLLGTAAFPASAARGDREAYFAAANQPKMQDRLRELELFASSTETSDLKIHALELMSWYYKQLGAEAEANRWARQLLTFDAENPLALSVLVENARRANPTAISQETLSFAQRGLRRAERFEKPDALPDVEFVQLRQRMLGILNGTVGYFYFQQKDYANARTYLRKALSFIPDDTYYVYALALANLEEKGGDQSEGYWYLARTVNLTQGTPAGKQLADYAAARYQQAGGTANNWKQFLAAAAAPAASAAAQTTVAASASSVPPSTSTSQPSQAAQKPTGTTTAASTPPAGVPPLKPATPPTTKGIEVASATVPNSAAAENRNPTSAGTQSRPTSAGSLPQSDENKTAATAPRSQAAPAVVQNPSGGELRGNTTEVASLTTPPPPVVQRPPISPRDPVSLGILIETTIATSENRSAVIYALVDMVRHLRNADEAFILSFGQQLEFHQDLTQNYDLLEEAMSSITPAEGAALLDAVGFSSGHLKRIAKNSNRVLLVISDGRDFGSRTPTFESLRQIDASGVRVYCIGVGAMDASDRSRLQQLAARTGGRTTFVPNPLQFRAAARQIAAGLGLEFPM